MTLSLRSLLGMDGPFLGTDTGDLTGSGTLTATSTPVATQSLPLTGSGTLTARLSIGAISKLHDPYDSFLTEWDRSSLNVTVTGGRLEIALTNLYPTYFSKNSYDLTGSGAFVELNQPPPVGNGTTGALFTLKLEHPSYSNGLEWSWDNNTLRARYKVNGTLTTIPGSSIAYSATTKWLRIRENGGSIFWDTSPDGMTWTQRATLANPFPVTGVFASLQAGFFGTEPTPGVAAFDNFGVLPIAVSGSGTLGTMGYGPPVYSDDFNRTGELIGSGPGWTNQSFFDTRRLRLANNAVEPDTTGDGGTRLYNVPKTGPNGVVKIDLTATSGNAGIVVRQTKIDNANNSYFLFSWGTGAGGQLSYSTTTVVNGSSSSTGSTTPRVTAPSTMAVVYSGSTMLCYADGALIFNVTTTVTGGSAGIYLAEGTTTQPVIDNFLLLGDPPIKDVSLTGSGTLSATSQIVSQTPIEPGDATGAGTLSQTNTPLATRTAGPTGSGALSSLNTPLATRSLSLSGSGTLSATLTPGMVVTAGLSGSGTQSQTNTPKSTQPLGLTGSGSLSVTSTAALSAALTGAGTLSTSNVIPRGVVQGSLTGSGQLSDTALVLLTRSGDAVGVGTLSHSSLVSLVQPGALSGTGVLSATSVPLATRPLSVSGSGTLSSTSASARTVAGSLSGSGQASVSAQSTLTQAAALSGSGTLSASSIAVVSVSGALSGTGTLTTTSSGVVSTAVQLSGTGTLSVDGHQFAAATASGTGSLTATTTPRTTSSAALSGSGTLSAVPVVVATQDVALSGSGITSDTATPSGTRTPAVSGLGTLSATSSTALVAQAELTALGVLDGFGYVGTQNVSLGGSGTLLAVQGSFVTTLSGTGSLAASITRDIVVRGALRTRSTTGAAQMTHTTAVLRTGSTTATLRTSHVAGVLTEGT